MTVTGNSDTKMLSPAEGELQLESALLCGNRSHCVPSSQDSVNSAQSCADPSMFCSPVTAASKYTLLLPADTSGLNGLCLAEMPADASWEPDSIASFGQLEHR